MNTYKELKNTSRLVEELLHQEPELRDSDKLLTVRVIEEIARKKGIWVHIPRELLPHLPAFETVKRVRAQLQNEYNLYTPTKSETIRKRTTRASNIKRWLQRADIQ